MASPARYLRALAASLATGLLVLTVPAAPAPAAYPTEVAPTPAPEPAQADDEEPLAVRIGTLTPGALPVEGPLRVTGTVTNRTDETWSNVKTYAFFGNDRRPMRRPAQLAAALQTPVDEVVGLRVTDYGARPGDLGTLEPGQTKRYVVTVPRAALQVSEPGVYWFGIHALGSSPSVPAEEDLGGVAVADGRARTFLPYVPRDYAPLPTAIVVPLTWPVHYAADGSVADDDAWAEALAPDGRLSRLLAFVSTSSRPVTWVVDPAMVDAIGRLAEGNPPRSLGSTLPDEGEGGEGGESTSPTGSGTPEPTGSPETGQPGGEPTGQPIEPPAEEPEPPVTPPTPRAQAAADWLDLMARTIGEDPVLTLPYGNVDVPATLRLAPELLDLAQAQRSTVLRRLGIDSTPVLTSPSGYLDAAAVESAPADTRLLITDRMFAAGEEAPPVVAQVAGHRALVTSYGFTLGTPGPSPSTTSTGLRQRLLAEAAVRVVRRERQPLVVTLPTDRVPGDAVGFFAGLSGGFVDLGTVDDVDAAAASRAVEADELLYPPRQVRRELDPTLVDAATDLVGAGDTLQNVLTENGEIGGVVTEEALTSLSYATRDDEASARLSLASARAWIDERLGGIRIAAAPGLTLSGASGEFVVTVTNTLEERVTVAVRVESDSDIELSTAEQIDLAPGARATVPFSVRTTTNRVHNVRLVLTDTAGEPLGASDELPIRSAQVSGVIWLIMGTGAGLLLLAIVVRLVRRIRTSRAPAPIDAEPPLERVGAS